MWLTRVPTFVQVVGTKVGVGNVLQLLAVEPVQLQDVMMLVTDHTDQASELFFQTDHLLLTRLRNLDTEFKAAH